MCISPGFLTGMNSDCTMSFNAPKGSLCISPMCLKCIRIEKERFQCPEGLIVYFTIALALVPLALITAAVSFNAPKGSLCISPSRGELLARHLLGCRHCFNAPKGSLCISPLLAVASLGGVANCQVSMPRRAHCVFHQLLLSIQLLLLTLWFLCFNAPKGSLCISPKRGD